MKKVERFDELPNKIKYVVGGGKTSTDDALRHFGDMNVYECKNKSEVEDVMKRQSLECMTMLDKDPLQGRSYFVALGMPGRKTVDDLIFFNPIEVFDTVVYFAELSDAEVREVRRDEFAARQQFRETLQKKRKNNESKQTDSNRKN